MAEVGMRFHPTDKELVGHYLINKIQGNDQLVDHVIGLLDVYQLEPWTLPQLAVRASDDQVWYFFCRRDLSNGGRVNRRTRNGRGFWKATGNPRFVRNTDTWDLIGSKRTLVYYFRNEGIQPIKTDWVIHEYNAQTNIPNQMVLCKLKYKGDVLMNDLPEDEGEPPHHMDFDGNNPQVPEVDAQLVGLEMQMEPPDPSASSNQLESSEDEIDPVAFSDSLLNDEAIAEALSHDDDRVDLVAFSDSLLNDEAIAEAVLNDDDSILADTYSVHTKANQSREYQQSQTVQDVTETVPPASNLSATGASSAAAPPIKKDPEYHQIFRMLAAPMPPLHSTKQISSKEIIDLESKKAINSSRDKAKGTAKKESYSRMFEKDTKMVQVINPKPEEKMKSIGSFGSGRKSSFLYMDKPQSSHTPSPPSVHLLNVLVALFLFIAVIKEMLISH